MARSEIMRDLSSHLTDGELKRFMDLLDCERDRLLFNLLYRTGRRVGEVLQLRLSDIDFDDKMINWTIEKKNPIKKKKDETMEAFEISRPIRLSEKRQYRTLKPIDSYCLNMLRTWAEIEKLGPSEYIFKSPQFKKREGKPMTRYAVDKLSRKYAIRAGIKVYDHKRIIDGKEIIEQRTRFHTHCLRHTYAIRRIKRLKSPSEIIKLQRWLEHSSLDITQFYLQFRNDEMLEMLDEEEI